MAGSSQPYEPLPGPAEWPGGRPGATADPADRVTLDESVSMAFLVVLDSMTPAQRVALILHDVFGYPFADIADIAEITGRTPAACRQLASSARRRIRASQPPAAPAARQAAIIRDFKKAWEAGDIGALIGLLDPGATVIADGGGLATAALRPIEGGEQIARYVADLAGRAPGSVTILEHTVNGQPGLVAQHDGVTVTVFAFAVAGDRITHIWAVRNPDKLQVLTAQIARGGGTGTAAWLDLCCGSGSALIQAAGQLCRAGLAGRAVLVGVDLVDAFDAAPGPTPGLELVCAPAAHGRRPGRLT